VTNYSLVSSKRVAIIMLCLLLLSQCSTLISKVSLYCAFLDANKAFYKVLINELLWKLIQRSVPVCLIQILYYWFNNLRCSVVGCPWLVCHFAYVVM